MKKKLALERIGATQANFRSEHPRQVLTTMLGADDITMEEEK